MTIAITQERRTVGKTHPRFKTEDYHVILYRVLDNGNKQAFHVGPQTEMFALGRQLSIAVKERKQAPRPQPRARKVWTGDPLMQEILSNEQLYGFERVRAVVERMRKRNEQ